MAHRQTATQAWRTNRAHTHTHRQMAEINRRGEKHLQARTPTEEKRNERRKEDEYILTNYIVTHTHTHTHTHDSLELLGPEQVVV